MTKGRSLSGKVHIQFQERRMVIVCVCERKRLRLKLYKCIKHVKETLDYFK